MTVPATTSVWIAPVSPWGLDRVLLLVLILIVLGTGLTAVLRTQAILHALEAR